MKTSLVGHPAWPYAKKLGPHMVICETPVGTVSQASAKSTYGSIRARAK